jgi:hypothetical protein
MKTGLTKKQINAKITACGSAFSFDKHSSNPSDSHQQLSTRELYIFTTAFHQISIFHFIDDIAQLINIV